MKGSHPRPADQCPFVLGHSISQVTSFMQLGMLWRQKWKQNTEKSGDSHAIIVRYFSIVWRKRKTIVEDFELVQNIFRRTTSSTYVWHPMHVVRLSCNSRTHIDEKIAQLLYDVARSLNVCHMTVVRYIYDYNNTCSPSLPAIPCLILHCLGCALNWLMHIVRVSHDLLKTIVWSTRNESTRDLRCVYDELVLRNCRRKIVRLSYDTHIIVYRKAFWR